MMPLLAMTHDQALIPIKTPLTPPVNVSLGLPIIRTSPDHGTAYDIAGKDIARPDSLIAAIKKAVDMAKGWCTMTTEPRLTLRYARTKSTRYRV